MLTVYLWQPFSSSLISLVSAISASIHDMVAASKGNWILSIYCRALFQLKPDRARTFCASRLCAILSSSTRSFKPAPPPQSVPIPQIRPHRDSFSFIYSKRGNSLCLCSFLLPVFPIFLLKLLIFFFRYVMKLTFYSIVSIIAVFSF